MFNLRYRRLVVLLVFSLLLIACQGPAEETPPPSERPPTEATLIGTPSEALPPTQTAQASSTPGSPLVLLVAPETANSSLVAELQGTLEELAAAEDFRFQTVSSLSSAQLSPGLRVVVALPPDPGLSELAAAEPGIQFLGVNIPGLETTANLSTIGPTGARPDQLGFLAGYTAAVITPEWRVGAITVSDTAEGAAVRDGFLNGVVFFCGLCQQIYPPYNEYPLYGELPGESGLEAWQSVADTLIAQAVETVYISPGAEQEELVVYLASAGVNIIGNNPPPAGAQNRWVASVGVDLAGPLRAAWPELTAGQAVGQVAVQPEIFATNPELFSPGRQLAVEEILPDLQAGFIDTGVDRVEPESATP